MRVRQINLRKLWLSLLLLVGATAIAIPGIQEVAGIEDTIEIGTVDELKAFRDAVNSGNQFAGKTVKLTADLDLSGESNWTPIGNLVAYPTQSFNGTFDGDGHSISNVTVNDNTPNHAVAGLFGSVVNGTIKNLTVKNVNLTSTHYAGGIVAYTSNGPTIENCKVIGGTIKSTPEIVNGSYDNGDKIGGIMGYATAGSTINNCWVEGVTLSAYRDLGGIVGYSAGTVTNNTAKNVTVTQDLTNGYKGTTPTTIGDIIGRDEGATLSNNTVIKSDPVAQIGETKYETIADAVAAANAGDVIEIIKAGDYTLPTISKNVTIEGAVDGVVFNHTTDGNVASIPNGATFKNVTFNFGNVNYHGFQHPGTINMEGCTLNGKLFSYGDMNFTNCSFENADDYNMWVYGEGEVVYDQCTFTNTTLGKMLHLYCEDANQVHKVTVKDCKFVNGGSLSKAAINVKATSGSNALQYELHLEGNNTYEGNFPTTVGEQANTNKTWILSPLAQVDDRKVNPDNITVYKNDELIYPVSYVAAIGDVNYTTLEGAFAAVQNGETVTLLDNLSLNDKLIVSLGDKAVTLDLGGNTLTGRTNLTSGSLTVKNGSVEQLDGDGQPLNVYGTATAGAENYSVLTVAEDVTVSGDYGVCLFGPSYTAKAGYGAVANIAGTLNGTKGTVFVSGNLGNNINGDMNNVINITGNINGNNDAGVALNGNATVNVKSGAVITGNTGIAVKRGVLNVEEGAAVHGTGAENLNPDPNNNGTEMTGAAISMTDTYNNYGEMAVNITGGTFTSDNTVALFKEDGTYANAATYSVSGGIFNTAVPAEFCAEGYVPVKISEGKYSVAQGSYVAQIGEDKYVSLQSAIDAAHEMTGDVTIELIDNITGYSIVHQKAGLNLTIDGADKTVAGQIIVDGDGNLDGTDVLNIQNIKFEMPSEFCTGTDAFVVVPSTKTAGTPYYDPSHNNHAHNITISDCTFTGNYPTSNIVGFKSHSGIDGMKNLVMENVTATNLHSLAQLTAAKGVTFDNCTATQTGSFIGANGGDGTYTVSNCTFESHPDKADGYAYREKSGSTAVATLTNNNFKAHDAIILGSAGEINVESGTYVGEISKTAGTIAISGGKFSAQLGNETYADFIADGYMGMNNIYSDEATPNGVVSADKAVMYTATNGSVTFYDALPSAFSSGTYKLLKDITRTTRMTPGIMATDVTLDLNGHTLTSTATDCAILLSRTGTSSTPKTFNLIDTSDEKGGILKVNPDANIGIQVSGKYNQVTIGEGVTIDGDCVALLSENQTLTVNGTINGGNDFAVATNGSTTKNATIIVNEGAVLTSDETAMYLPGNEGLMATINGGTITGGKTGVEIRAGQLVVNGGDITSTATEYSYTSNGNGTTTKGAAIAVVQHNTKLPIDAQILGGTLTGLNQIAVVDAQENNLEDVSVKAKDELTATTTIPEDFKWVAAQTEGMSTLAKKTYVAQIGDDKYESLAAAVAAVPADVTEATTIKMIANEMINVVGSAITIPTNKNVVIDLNGFQVVGTAEGGSTSALITNKGTLTIKDSSDTNKDGTGTGKLISGATTTWIYEGDGNYAGSYASNTITNSGTLTIESGYVENLSTGSATYAVDNNSSGGNAILNMNGGLLKARSVAVRQFANSTTLKNEVNIAGGTVTAGYSGIWIQLPGSDATKAMKASLNVTGGTLTGGSYAFYDYSYGNSFDATQYNLDGGTFDGAIFSYGANINITDGTYNGEVAIKQAKPSNVAVSGGKFGDDVYTYGDNASEGFITGGVFAINTYEYEGNTYDCDWLNCLAEDYVVSDNTDPETKDAYPYAVRQANYICAIGTTKYETLADAVAAAGTAETTITLLTEAATDGVISGDGVVVPSGSNITFDLNGLTYNVTGETVGSTGYETQAFQLLKDSKVTFTNGTITSTTAKMLIQNYCNLTLTDVTLDGSNLIGSAPYTLSNNSGNVNLNGETNIIAKDGGFAFDTCKFGSYAIPTVNINTTGAITGPIEATGGKLNIENGKFNVTWVTDNNYAAGDIQIKGGVFSAEPAEEYCAKGYVAADNEDEATKAEYPFAVMTKEDAGIFELIDGKVYPYLDYTEDKPAASVTYKRNFANNNWQALFIPFDINDVTKLTDKYEFAKVHMVALENDGTFTTGNKIEIYYTRVTSGKLSANQPYLIKLKNEAEQGWQDIVVENTILKDTHNMTPRKTSTMAADYYFTGTYEGYVGEKYHDFMAMGSGTINWGNTGHKLGTYRWYIKTVPFNDDYAKTTISFIEADEDATSISAANADENTEIEGYYSVNGVRSDVPVKGMNIVKYKNGKTKKIMIK